MAEVGLLAFTRTALAVSRAVLPPYRTRFSKHQFTQPQLLAILCLMRYEDWTFREAEVRLTEHRELRQTLGLSRVPDFTTLYRFLQRLDGPSIDRAVDETVRRMRGRRGYSHRRARVAVDATGLAQGAVSTFFVRRLHHHGQKPLPWRHWLKWVVVADLDQQFLLSQQARRGPWNDCASLPAVVETASQQTRIGLVLADAEFDSERNHTYVRRHLGARSVIPAKRGKKTWQVRGVRAEMRRAFPRKLYRQRALIETLFSSVKRKLSARAPGRTLPMQMRQALLLGLSFNLYRLKHRYIFLRMSTEPKRLKTLRVLTPPEFKALLLEPDEPYKAMVVTIACLGLRVCELMALQWGDIDFESLAVKVQRSFVEGHIYATKNEASIADLPLDPNLAELLLYHKRQSSFSGNSDFIFAGDSGEPRWPDILLTDHIKPAARKVGIGNIGWHTYSTLLHALGTTPAVQKELLCHVGIQTTMNIYTHAVTPAKREAAFKVVDLLWRG